MDDAHSFEEGIKKKERRKERDHFVTRGEEEEKRQRDTRHDAGRFRCYAQLLPLLLSQIQYKQWSRKIVEP